MYITTRSYLVADVIDKVDRCIFSYVPIQHGEDVQLGLFDDFCVESPSKSFRDFADKGHVLAVPLSFG